MSDIVKYVLDDTRLPVSWYSLVADLPSPPPPVLHPGTLAPVGPHELAPLFPMSLIMQEVLSEREIEIPKRCGRSTAVAPEPSVSSPPSRGRAADAGAHLLQVRGREPSGQPEAQHCGAAGLL